MKKPDKPDAAHQWLTTLTWADMLIARLLPKFFQRYAPDELKEQWAAYLEKRRASSK